jgi:hypothetical protein
MKLFLAPKLCLRSLLHIGDTRVVEESRAIAVFAIAAFLSRSKELAPSCLNLSDNMLNKLGQYGRVDSNEKLRLPVQLHLLP